MRKLFLAAVAAVASVAMPMSSQAAFTVTAEGSGVLASAVTVDMLGDGTFSGDAVTVGGPGVIASGTFINSYHFDSFGGGSDFYDFGTPILGIIVSDGINEFGLVFHPGTDAFAASNAAIAAAVGGPLVTVVDGLEAHFLGVDGITVSGTTITFGTALLNLDTDNFRVLTAIPEPASMAVWGLASVVGLCAYRVRRRKVA